MMETRFDWPGFRHDYIMAKPLFDIIPVMDDKSQSLLLIDKDASTRKISGKDRLNLYAVAGQPLEIEMLAIIQDEYGVVVTQDARDQITGRERRTNGTNEFISMSSLRKPVARGEGYGPMGYDLTTAAKKQGDQFKKIGFLCLRQYMELATRDDKWRRSSAGLKASMALGTVDFLVDAMTKTANFDADHWLDAVPEDASAFFDQSQELCSGNHAELRVKAFHYFTYNQASDNAKDRLRIKELDTYIPGAKRPRKIRGG